jgi:hypothetical protein
LRCSATTGLEISGSSQLENITLQGCQEALKITGKNVRLVNVKFEQNVRAILITQDASVILENATVLRNGDKQFSAIRIEKTAKLEIRGGRFEQNLDSALTARDNSILGVNGAIFDNNSTTDTVNPRHIDVKEQADVLIEKSRFLGSRYSINGTPNTLMRFCGNEDQTLKQTFGPVKFC